MINIKEIDCVGCTACASVCVKSAITMEKNEKGFNYPKINLEKCIDCGLCDKTCVARKEKINYENETKIYAAKNSNVEERKKSQSGGAFYVFAKYVLSKGGVVFGARLSNDCLSAIHIKVDCIENLHLLQGTKYVQSNLDGIFSEVKMCLDKEQLVLFSGTPCQVAGLKAFLKIDYDNLITVDLICHGVPSPKIWQDYLQWQKLKHGNLKLDKVDFRDRESGWGSLQEALWFSGKKTTSSIYTKLYYSKNLHRESCFNCKFSNIKRISDITVGDFWGIENVEKSFYDRDGVSIILLHSLKGNRLFVKCDDMFEYIQSNDADATLKNPQLKQPVTRPETYEKFWKDYFLGGIDFVSKKYGGNNLKGKIKRIIKKILKRS